MSEQDAVDVIFRRWPKVRGGEIIAIFPEIDAGNGLVLMYEHVGQHGGGSYGLVMERTTAAPADDPDVVALRTELEGKDYRLKLRRRANPKTMRSKR